MNRDPFDILDSEHATVSDAVRREIEQQLAVGGTAASFRDGAVIVEARDGTRKIGRISSRETLAGGEPPPTEQLAAAVAHR